jgi:hypothetical protein
LWDDDDDPSGCGVEKTNIWADEDRTGLLLSTVIAGDSLTWKGDGEMQGDEDEPGRGLKRKRLDEEDNAGDAGDVISSYASQDDITLSINVVDTGCGIICVHNMFVLFQMEIPTSVIMGAFLMVKKGNLDGGLSPIELFDMIMMVIHSSRCSLRCELIASATIHKLCAGSLVYVNGAALASICLPTVFNAPDDMESANSHIVMVEAVSKDGITIINPDTGCDGQDKEWGRFIISVEEMESVWKTIRHDMSTTEHTAIIPYVM